MLDCIREQPAIARRILADEDRNHAALQAVLDGRRIRRVLFIATGSSMNAVQAAIPYVERVSGTITRAIEPFQFAEYGIADHDADLVVAVSQRGTSSSTIDAVQRARGEFDAPVLVVTGHLDSPIVEHVDAAIDIGCGPEDVPYSTMGVTATILTLFLVALRVAEHQGTVVPHGLGREALAAAVEKTGDTIDRAMAYFDAHAEELSGAGRITVLGYGPNIGTAMEAETKMIETVRVPVQGMELEAYMHGPLFELRRDHLLLLTEVAGTSASSRTRRFADFAGTHCDHVHIVTTSAGGAARELGLGIDSAEEITPLLLVIPYQVFAAKMSAARGIDLTSPVFPDFHAAMGTKVKR